MELINLYKTLSIGERINLFKKYDYLSSNYSDQEIYEWNKGRRYIGEENFENLLKVNSFTKEEYYTAIKDEIDPDYLKKIENELLDIEWYKVYLNVLNFNGSNSWANITKDPSCVLYMFIKWARYELINHTTSLNNISISDNALVSLLNCIVENTTEIYIKTFINDFHTMKDTIKTNSNESKLSKFIEEQFGDIAKTQVYLEKYPTILRRMVVKVNNLVAYFKQMFNDFDINYYKISKLFNLDDKIISKIIYNKGDTHQNGKFVIEILIDNKKLLYKPKNLKVEKNYNKFINWFNCTSGLLSLPTVKTFFEEEFAIQQFISSKECETDIDIKNYYQRYGQLIAIIYILNGNDIHNENLIACCDTPYIIDLETILQRNLSDSFNSSLSGEHLNKITEKFLKKILTLHYIL